MHDGVLQPATGRLIGAAPCSPLAASPAQDIPAEVADPLGPIPPPGRKTALRRVQAATLRAARRHPAFLLLLALNVTTHLRWFNPRGYLTYGDLGVYLPRAQHELGTLTFSAQVGGSLGGPELAGSYHPVQAAFAVLAHLGVGFPLGFKLLFLWPFLVVSAYAAEHLLRQLVRTVPGIVVGGCLLLFNTYTLTLQTGNHLLLMGDALLVLWLSQLLRLSLTGPTRARLVTFGLIGTLLAAYEFRIFYLGVALLGAAAVFLTAWLRSWKPLLYVVGGTIFTLGLNASWLFELGNQGLLTSNPIFNRVLFGTGYFDLASAIALFDRFWTGSAIAVFTVQPIPPTVWIVPLAAVVGYASRRRDPMIFFFLLVALAGIALTKMSAPPFPDLYQFLFTHVPGFNAFREASKFYIITALGYAVLVGACTDKLARYYRRGDAGRVLATVGITFLACIFIVNARPLVSGAFGTIFVPRERPPEYSLVDRLLSASGPQSYRTLWVPATSRWSPYDLEHPAIHLTGTISTDWARLHDLNAQVQRGTYLEQASYFFAQSWTRDLLDGASVRYVVVPVDDPAAGDDEFNGIDRAGYLQLLDGVPWLRRLPISATRLTVYENASWAPVVVADGGVSKRLSPAAYAVLTTLRGDQRLTLGLLADRGWRLSPGRLADQPLCPGPQAFSVVREQPHARANFAVSVIGDTPSKLATREHVPLRVLLALNPGLDGRASTGGQHLTGGTVVNLPATPPPPPATLSTAVCAPGGGSPLAVGISVHGRQPDASAAGSTNSWLNTWSLSPAQVMADFPATAWRRNGDGSITASLLLRYEPQATFNRGMLLALVLLAGTVLAFALWPLALRQQSVAEWALANSHGCRRPRLLGLPAVPVRPFVRTVHRASRSIVGDLRRTARAGRVATRPRLRRALLRSRGAQVANDCVIGSRVHVSSPQALVAGSGAIVGDDCHLAADGGLFIARRAVLAARVLVASQPPRGDQSRLKPVVIGASTVVGAGAVIGPGVSIGEAAVIAPGSVVLRDVLPGRHVSGNPARAGSRA